MTFHRLSLVLAAGMLVACGEPPADEAAPPPESADMAAPSSDEAAIAALGDYWETHYNMQHADMVASVYADSAWISTADGAWVEGRPAIESWLRESMAPSPTAQVTSAETVMAGDMAMGIGSYTVSATPEGAEPMAFSGSWFNVLTKVDGEWKILGSVNNYDSPRPDGWEWAPATEGDPPADDPSFPESTEAYEDAWNAGDAAALAAMYTEDARVSFSNAPLLEGRAQVEAAMAERSMPGATIRIHEVGHMEMGEGMRVTGGWYEIQGPDGAGTVQTGIWMNLLEIQADGTPMIRWTVSNGRPAGM